MENTDDTIIEDTEENSRILDEVANTLNEIVCEQIIKAIRYDKYDSYLKLLSLVDVEYECELYKDIVVMIETKPNYHLPFLKHFIGTEYGRKF